METGQGQPWEYSLRKYLLLLATLVASITYSAGFNPPGGVWQEGPNDDGQLAGDPIIRHTHHQRHLTFFYCNTTAFIASLVVIILILILAIRHDKKKEKKGAIWVVVPLRLVMVLDLLSLVGAYATGTCRDKVSSLYSAALVAAIFIYIVLLKLLDWWFPDSNSVPTRTLKRIKAEERLNKVLMVLATFAVSITYQAGLTPPGGFLLQDDNLGHHAGDPVLLRNNLSRYKAFFYCNSVSFMLSITLIILLVNPTVYRPAIQSNALSVCTAVGLFCLMGAYAAGSTQDIKTSIYIFVLVVLVLFIAAGLLVVFLVMEWNTNANPAAARSIDQDAAKEQEEREEEERKKDEKGRKKHARRKYLMLVGILVASVAYQAGLEPPGGTWQSSSDGHEAGNPVMRDNMRGRFLVFFYSNSISFVASIVVIIMLLLDWLPKKEEECEEWFRKLKHLLLLLLVITVINDR